MHLTYCTNVHAAEDLAGIVAQLDTYAVPIRARLGADRARPRAVAGRAGRRPSSPPTRRPAAAAARPRRARAGGGDAQRVPVRGVPARSSSTRSTGPTGPTRSGCAYTLDLAASSPSCCPTTPPAARSPRCRWPGASRGRRRGRRAPRRSLDALAAACARWRATGRPSGSAFEPEPGCVDREHRRRRPPSCPTSRQPGHRRLPRPRPPACAWEDPAAALGRLRAAGLPVVKMQVSAALEAERSACGTRDALRGYVEPRFLHQTRAVATATAAPTTSTRPSSTLPPGPWRVHYHVPLHADPVPPLRATTGAARPRCAAVRGGRTPLRPPRRRDVHLERAAAEQRPPTTGPAGRRHRRRTGRARDRARIDPSTSWRRRPR